MARTRKQRRLSRRVLRIESRRTVRSTWARWVSIACLMMLGAFAFVGIKVAGPDMRATAQNFFDETRLADGTVTSTWGLDADDQEAIRSAAGVAEVEFGDRTDVVVSGTHRALRVMSTPVALSQPVVVEGEMPADAGEIALDYTLADDYSIGQWLGVEEAQAAKLGTDDVLRRRSFKVVGFVKSPEYLTQRQYGATTIGTGQLQGFAYVMPATFTSRSAAGDASGIHTIARIRFDGTEGLGAYSDEYGRVLDERTAAVEAATAPRAKARLDEMKADKQKEIDDGRRQLADAQKKLADAHAKVDDAAAQLDESRGELSDARADYQSQLSAGRTTLSQARTALTDAESTLAQRSQELSNAQARLSQARIAASNAQSELDASKAQLDAEQADLDSKRNDLEAARKGFEDQIAALQAAIEQAQKAGDQQKVKELTAQRDAAQTACDQFMANTYTPGLQAIEAGQAQIGEGLQKWSAGTADLAALRDDIERGQAEFDQGSAALESGRSQLSAQSRQVAQGEVDAERQAAEGQAQLDQAQRQIDSGQQELDKSKQDLATQEKDADAELATKTKDLDKAQADLDALKAPTFTVADRRDDTPYSMYGDTSTRVDVLARVFPVLLFGVAAMVSLTTMTRMVEEERQVDGTHAALGYGRRDITRKYLTYGASAATVGALLGIAIGHTLLPKLIFDAYSATSILDHLDLGFFPVDSLISLAVALACTIAVSYWVARSELKEVPARLLQPKAPKAGTRILLERIGPLWRRMPFTQKVTFRNLFRYKRRALMTVFGVLGCTALLLTGFGLRDSVKDIVPVQFGELVHYDIIAARSDDATDDELADVQKALQSDSGITAHTETRYVGLHTIPGDDADVARQDVSLISPADPATFGDFVTLRTPAGHDPIDLQEAGAVLSQAMAGALDAGVGDTVTFADSDDVERTFTVGAITEMYVGNYLFCSRDAYERAFDEGATGAPAETGGTDTGAGATATTAADTDDFANATLVRLADSSTDGLNAASAKLMDLKAMGGVVPTSAMKNAIGGFLDGVDMVVAVMMLAAILLALVVVFNLTNINVSERIRELSTIKVLGFYNTEVTMYVFREIFLLTAIGIGVGSWAGNLLHGFIARELPPEGVRLIPGVEPVAYLWSALVTVAATLVVAVLMHRRLANIDMLGALKSVD